MRKTWYKILDENDQSCHGGKMDWRPYLPTQLPDGSWEPGAWTPPVYKLVMCISGYHLADADHLAQYTNKKSQKVYEAEYTGCAKRNHNKVVVHQVRLLRKVNWSEKIARLYMCDCAERVLPIYEKAVPGDFRLRQAVEVARRYARGQFTRSELSGSMKSLAISEVLVRASKSQAAKDVLVAIAYIIDGTVIDVYSELITIRRAVIHAAEAEECDQSSALVAEKKWQRRRMLDYLEGRVTDE